jgi:hypothetical protein
MPASGPLDSEETCSQAAVLFVHYGWKEGLESVPSALAVEKNERTRDFLAGYVKMLEPIK